MKNKSDKSDKNNNGTRKHTKTLKQTEEKLRASEERARLLSEAAEVGIAIHDKGVIVDANQALADMFGYELSEMIGMNTEKLSTTESWKVIWERIAKRYDKPYEGVGVRKDGSNFICSLVGKPYKYKGRTLRVKAFRDITERRKTEEKYRNILENIQEGYFEVDLAGNYTFLNDSMCRIHGYPKKELMGMNNRQYLEKEAAKKVFQAFNGVYKTGKPLKEIGWQIIRKDETRRYIEASISLREDSSGKPIGFRGIIRDITDRKLAEEKLRESEANYRQLFDNSPAGIYQIDYKNGKFLKANELFCEYAGCSQKEITSLSPYDILTEESRKLFLERVEKISQGLKVPETVEFETLNKKGERFYIQLHAKNIYDAEGHVVAADVVAHDITKRKRAEEELRRFAENLEDANIALRVLMNQRNVDQKEFEEKLQVNINDLVIPYLKKLSKANLDDRSKSYVSILESNLNDVLSPFMRDFRSSHKKLTPQEIQIVDLILKGKNTKEIADMLHASANTIATHRNNIRKKMNLRNSKINLRSHILSLK